MKPTLLLTEGWQMSWLPTKERTFLATHPALVIRRAGPDDAAELAELGELIAYVRERVPAAGPITDAARWTLWWGIKPA